MGEDRKQRRLREREDRDRLRRVASQGIDPGGGLAHLVALKKAILGLLDGDGPSRASDAAKFATDAFSTSVERHGDPAQGQDRGEIACRAGCSYCCHGFVSATAPEIFHLARTLRARHDEQALLARLRAADALTRGLAPGERLKARHPCAVLEDNLCGAYAARPTSCRAFVSLSLAACERSWAGHRVDIPVPNVNLRLRGSFDLAIRAALRESGLDERPVELNHGLLVAIETPDAERRWLAGEDIFAAVAGDPSEAEQGAEKKEALEQVIRAIRNG